MLCWKSAMEMSCVDTRFERRALLAPSLPVAAAHAPPPENVRNFEQQEKSQWQAYPRGDFADVRCVHRNLTFRSIITNHKQHHHEICQAMICTAAIRSRAQQQVQHSRKRNHHHSRARALWISSRAKISVTAPAEAAQTKKQKIINGRFIGVPSSREEFITNAVITRFFIDTGSNGFPAKTISWSPARIRSVPRIHTIEETGTAKPSS